MADSLLSSLLSSKGGALTVVNNASRKDVAEHFQISRVTFKYTSKVLRHMLEDGSTIVDARVTEPVTVSIDAIAPTLDEINTASNMLKDRKDTYTLTSRGLVVNDMSTEDIRIKQSADMISASPVRISMKQLMRQGGVSAEQHEVVEQPADSSILGRGVQAVQKVGKSVTDAFSNTIRDIKNVGSIAGDIIG